ncbi:MAG: hypothetical protein ABI847_09610, partial [Anaerolineales bacterium]
SDLGAQLLNKGKRMAFEQYGVSVPEHLYEVLTDGHADAALVASMLHFGEYTVDEIKDYLQGHGLKMRRTARQSFA